MSEQKLISPLLDGFVMGAPMSSRGGIRCCPAIKENSDEKYIVKIISVPSSQVQLDALLLTGAYKTPSDAAEYFREVAAEIENEAEFLSTVAKLDGFLPFEGWQTVPMEDGKLGYQVYLLSRYKRSLQRHMSRKAVTHLEAVNLGLDLCAALAICRRAGYLYVDLKPENIFLTPDKQFRIGDLGFVKLDSLAYASLPGKYRSAYSPPEALDDLKTLSDTTDTYAVGMILYQIYNEGTLPASADPKAPFPCPANADYEISAIIMKAIDPDPAKRWSDPMAMGQALVRYMQKNSVNNTPILPPSGLPLNVTEERTPENALPNNDEAIPAETDVTDASAISCEEASVTEEESNDASVKAGEVLQEEISEDLYDETDIADEFPEENSDPEELDDLDFSIAFTDYPETELPADVTDFPEPRPVPIKKQRVTTAQIRMKQIRNLLITLMVLIMIGFGAYWLHQNYYLQEIQALHVEGSQKTLTVTVETDIKESMLEVSCTDTYGNTVIQPLSNGQCTFTDLLPASLYRIELNITGLHQLIGPTSEIFTTESMSNVISIAATTGPEDGSVLLNLTVDGPEPEQWQVTCTAEGEETVVQTFAGHSVTVKNLTIGKLYTMSIAATDGTGITGQESVDFVVTPLILARNLRILSCQDGILSVAWDAPEDVDVEYWKVRCYSDDGQEVSLEITGTEIAFTDIDNSKEYTVEVTAVGMTESSRVTLTANPITVTGFQVDASDPMRINISWDFNGNAPDGGWLLFYTLDGAQAQQSVVKTTQASAVIEPHIPAADYHLTLQAADSTYVFGNSHSFATAEPAVFNQHDLSAATVSSYLLKTPEEEGWTAETISQDLYTSQFQSGDSISVVLKTTDAFLLPKDVTPILYVIRDADGNVLSKYVAEENVIWEDLWYPDNYHNCELTLPKIPSEPGAYNVTIYFNYYLMASADFTIQ